MGPFQFWARELIAATDEDRTAAEQGTLSPQRSEELAAAGIAARERLAEMTVPGYQEWMTHRRACN